MKKILLITLLFLMNGCVIVIPDESHSISKKTMEISIDMCDLEKSNFRLV